MIYNYAFMQNHKEILITRYDAFTYVRKFIYFVYMHLVYIRGW
jgi:hypothetical protein